MWIYIEQLYVRSKQYYKSLTFKTVIKFWVRSSTGADKNVQTQPTLLMIGLLNYVLFQIVRKHVYEIKLVIELSHTTKKRILPVVRFSNLSFLMRVWINNSST